ncbi:amino acid transporter [Putridiphycobacter roseus]|uniref:Amino acid transporter n=1 Tax=Putridiphycobacter roseus TaxID=2219161 RepID=A0A2W1N340_9FLAO|nr:APC family permease [Putridiphycobacter roseus]PZE18737.1 amino acid transporter [Putridiphycobacter roseus]
MRKNKKSMSVISAASMGVGAMVGAGIFALLGDASAIAGNLVYIPFGIAGIVTLFLGYSYSKLGVRFPSMGGPVEYIIQGFGTGVSSGAFNILYWFALISGIAMVAKAFGNYAAAIMPNGFTEGKAMLFTAAIIVFFTLLNFLGSSVIGNLEKWIVSIKLLILLVFSCVALFFIQPELMVPPIGGLNNSISVMNAVGVVFFAFTGFGIISNTVEDMANPKKDLPRAIFLSISIVIFIYILISIAVVGNLPYAEIVKAKDYALAEAAKPILGNIGFKIMAIAALLSTASAINASLYGAANISYMIAKRGELPSFFERRLWKKSTEGLLITASLILLMALFLDLGSIASVGSAIMLLIYILVNVSHLKLLQKTGAKPWAIWTGLLACAFVLSFFLYYKSDESYLTVIILLMAIALAFIIEFFIQKVIGRELKSEIFLKEK